MGYLAGFVVSMVWSGFYIVSRTALVQYFSPADVLFLRYVSSALVLIPFYKYFPIKKIGFWYCVLLGLLQGMLYAGFTYIGLQYVVAGYSALIVAGLMPFSSLLLEVAFKKRKISYLERFGLLLVFAGIVLFFPIKAWGEFSTEPRYILGIIFLLASSFIYAIAMYLMRHKEIKGFENLVCNAYVNFPIAIILFFLTGHVKEILTLHKEIVPMILLIVGYQGLLVNIGAVFLIGFAVRRIGPVSLAYFIAFVPPLTAIQGLLIGEPFTWRIAIALLMGTLGPILATLGKDLRYNKK